MGRSLGGTLLWPRQPRQRSQSVCCSSRFSLRADIGRFGMRGSVVSRQVLVMAAPVLLFLSVSFASPSQAQDKVELFGGYSYLRGSVQVGRVGPLGPGTPCPPNCGNPPTVAQHANLNGWEFSGQYKLRPFVGVVADFDGNYGTLDGGKTRVHTFVFGPQVSLPAKLSPFSPALFVISKQSQTPLTNPP